MGKLSLDAVWRTGKDLKTYTIGPKTRQCASIRNAGCRCEAVAVKSANIGYVKIVVLAGKGTLWKTIKGLGRKNPTIWT